MEMGSAVKLSLLKIFGAAAALSLASTAASAAVFNFSITYDGTSQSVDAGSDPTAGTMLTPGDSFTIDFHTDGDDYFNVLNSFNEGIVGSFLVDDGGGRTSNITTTLYLDGVQVGQNIQNGYTQSSVHIGGQGFSFMSGVQFDQMVVTLDFLSTAATMTEIQSNGLVFSFLDELGGNIEYVDVVDGAVPLPAAAFLFLAGLGGLTGRRFFAGK